MNETQLVTCAFLFIYRVWLGRHQLQIDFVLLRTLKQNSRSFIVYKYSPTGILLFVNRNNLGFEDIEDVDPTTSIELTSEDLKENADNILLQYVKYQRVKSITLFVEDNNGGEISSLGGLKFYGKPVATTNMADFKKQGWGH